MPAMFIRVDMTREVAGDGELANKLAEVCPVNIFAQAPDGSATIVEENLDECVLCELCVQAAPPGGVRVVKLYDGTVLER
jgi:NAD-dependent dihydropyrimidine dehydrogenase PreA subunit